MVDKAVSATHKLILYDDHGCELRVYRALLPEMHSLCIGHLVKSMEKDGYVDVYVGSLVECSERKSKWEAEGLRLEVSAI